MLANRAAHYQGYSNSATFTFNLYFMQERELYESIVALIRKAHQRGGLTDTDYADAAALMTKAYNSRKMEPFDGDEQGDVNVREIVDTLAAELRINPQ